MNRLTIRETNMLADEQEGRRIKQMLEQTDEETEEQTDGRSP